MHSTLSPPISVMNDDSTSTKSDGMNCTTNGGNRKDELVCVIAIIRHGERTPKQKSKRKTSHSEWISLYRHFCTDPKAKKEIKLKSPKELMIVMEMIKKLLNDVDTNPEEKSFAESILSVLTRYPLQGINRKIQVKPTAWKEDSKEDSMKALKVIEVQVICKWGGELTPDGLSEAKRSGENFRNRMYINENSGGLLRLHSTFRHDLKVYSSDEGRVQTTAAAFAKGMLALEGQIAPILASFIRKGQEANRLLDDCSEAKVDMQRVKDRLHTLMTSDTIASEISALNPGNADSIREALAYIKNPQHALKQLAELMTKFESELRLEAEAHPLKAMYDNETLSSMHDRWLKGLTEFSIGKGVDAKFNVSKISDVYDLARYDKCHNALDSFTASLDAVYVLAKALAHIVVPQEYGLQASDKLIIAQRVTASLREKIVNDLRLAAGKSELQSNEEEPAPKYNSRGAGFLDSKVKSAHRQVRSRIYVTSESHLYGMMEVLRNGPYAKRIEEFTGPHATAERKVWNAAMEHLDQTGTLGELTQIVCRLYKCWDGTARQHRVEWLISTGHEPPKVKDHKLTPVRPIIKMHSGLPLDIVETCLAGPGMPVDTSMASNLLSPALSQKGP